MGAAKDNNIAQKSNAPSLANVSLASLESWWSDNSPNTFKIVRLYITRGCGTTSRHTKHQSQTAEVAVFIYTKPSLKPTSATHRHVT